MAVVTWDGGGGDQNWNNPLNWDTDVLPGAGDDAMIPDLVGTPTISHSSGNTSIKSLDSSESVSVSGSLSVAETSEIDGSLSVQAGGTLAGSGSVTVHGLLTLSLNSGLATTGVTDAMGGIAIHGSTLVDGTLVNHATATWASNHFGIQDGGVFENLPGATFDIQSDRNNGNASGTFNNAGLVVKSAGTGTGGFKSVFNNNGGDIEVQTGILSLQGGGSTNDPIVFGPSAGVAFGSNFMLGADLDVPGDVIIAPGGLAGTGNLTVHGLLTLSLNSGLATSGVTDAMGGIAIHGSTLVDGTLVNHATATWASNHFGIQDGGVFENRPGATFDIQSDRNNGNASGTFNNAGLVVKSAGTGTGGFKSVFNNNGGDIEVQTGILSLQGGGSTNDPIVFGPSAGVAFGSNFMLGADLDVPGDVIIAPGGLAGTGNLTVRGLLTLSLNSGLATSGVTDAMGGIAIHGSTLVNGTLVNHATATWASNHFGIQDGGVFENRPGATFDIQNDRINGNALGTFNNAGLVVKSAGTGTGGFKSVFNNNGGDIEVQAGVLNFTGLNQIGGTNVVQLGADSGQFAMVGTLDSLGSLQVNLKSGFTPAIGQSFVIFDNDGTDPVAATYDGLPEGATLAVPGAVFEISYAGGTGNDIELTAIAPDPPPVIESTDVSGDLQGFLIQLNDDDLNPALAEDAANYQITKAGADEVFGTADDVAVVISDVEYDAVTDRITIRTVDAFFDDLFRLEIDGDDATTDTTPGIADQAGNHLDGGDFTVEFDLRALNLVSDLLDTTESLGLSAGAENSLTAKLDAVLTLLGVGTANDQGIIAKLNAFKTGVNHWFDHGDISEEERTELLNDAQLIIDGLELM